MFDIGFSELLVCGIVALVVIGPERLPRVARTLGVVFGRLQRYVAQVKSDINREMDVADLGKVKTEFESAARSFQSDFKSQAADVEREVRDAQAAIEQSLEKPAASPQMDLGIEVPPPPPLPPKGPGEQ
ncbi:MAG: twin-arginine translocase subunit TatB [Burkholderiales bacterium]|nr:twin-arginine translocase subunit TatB [Burkholderiales bacterium]